MEKWTSITNISHNFIRNLSKYFKCKFFQCLNKPYNEGKNKYKEVITKCFLLVRCI